jgi:hypothetical protein
MEVQFLEVALDARLHALEQALQFGQTEVARLGVDRLEDAPVDGHQLGAKELQLPAHQVELAQHLLEDLTVGAPELTDGLVVGLQALEQPDDLQVAVGQALQFTAGAHPVEVTIKVELEQIGGRVARAACHCWLKRQAHLPQIQLIDKSVDEAHRVVFSHVILDALRQHPCLTAVLSAEITHARSFTPIQSPYQAF